MKRKVVLAIVGIATVLQAGSVSAIDKEAVEKNGLKADYGFTVEAPDTSITADYNLEVSPDKVEKMSVGAIVKAGEENYDLKLDDILIIDPENIYINVNEGVDTVEGITGENADIDAMLRYFGITEDWVSFPIPEFDKLGIKFDSENAGKVPEFSEEMLNDLIGIATIFAPEESDGVITYKIDNEKLLEAAKQGDEFFRTHRDELLNLNASPAAGSDILKDLNLNAPFEKYINAVGAGMAQATGMDEAEAIAQINQMIEELTAQIVDSFAINYTANGEPITEESLDDLAIYDSAVQALEGKDILISLSYDENSAEFVWRTDNAETFVLDAAIQEDDTIKVELKRNGEVGVVGELSKTETGLTGTFSTPDGDEAMTVTLDLTENGFIAVAKLPDDQELSLSAEMSEDGIKLSVSVPETTISFTATGKSDDTTAAGKLSLDVDAAEGKAAITGYINVEVPSTPLVIEIPTATDGLEVIKNIAVMAFSSSQAE